LECKKARYFNKWIIDVIDKLTMSLMETTGIVDLKQGKLRYITILIQIKIEKKKNQMTQNVNFLLNLNFSKFNWSMIIILSEVNSCQKYYLNQNGWFFLTLQYSDWSLKKVFIVTLKWNYKNKIRSCTSLSMCKISFSLPKFT
jgi:hypothetical protein